MLVSIGIIGILSSISLPILSKAKAKAKRIKCVSNMRQIGQAHILFGGDNGDGLPWSVTRSKLGSHFVSPSMFPARSDFIIQVQHVQWQVLGIDPSITNPRVNNIVGTPNSANALFSIPAMMSALESAKMLHSPSDATQEDVSEIAQENWENYNAKKTNWMTMRGFNESQFIPQWAISYVLVRGADLGRPSTVLSATRNLSGSKLEDSEWVGADTMSTSTRAMAGLISNQGNLVLSDGSASQSSDSEIGPMGTAVNDHINSSGGKSLGPARTDYFGLD